MLHQSIHERHEPRHRLAASHVLGREAAPAPLVLEFVEAVFDIRTVAVELGDA